MKLTFRRIKIKNFLSIGNNPVEYEYHSGLNIVMGKNKDTMSNNGSGKTAILLSALTFGLFGRVPRKINKEDLVNSTNGAECEVEIELQKNQDIYIIRQGIDPRFISIEKNGEEFPPESTLYLDQKRINDILEIDYQTFLHTIFTCVNYSQPFLELGKSEKRGVIEDILGISIFGEMFEEAHNIYSESKIKYDNLYNEIKHLTRLVDERENHIENLKAEKEVFQDKKKKRLKQLKEDFDSLRESIQNSKTLVQRGDEIRTSRENLKVDLRNLERQLTRQERELAILKDSIKRKKANIESLIKEKKCDKCNTSITSKSVKKHIKSTKEDIKEDEQNLNILSSGIEDYRKIKKGYKDKISRLDKKLKDVSKHEFQLETDMNKMKELKNKFNEIKEEKFDINRFVNMKDQEKDIQRLQELQQNFLANEKNFKYAEYSRKLLSEKGVKSYIIRQILPFLNKKINEYLKKLSVSFTIKFDEELNEQITFNHKRNFSYANFSGGEKKRIDLALMLTLLDISRAQSVVDCNLQILDEVIDTSLDPVGVQLFQDILRERIAEDETKCIYIITHRSEINAESYDRIVKIIKERGFSRIAEEL